MTSMQISIFLAVAENLNFSRTAELFYTTQSTVSRQIKILEDEWGVVLFNRNRREVHLTDEGREIATYFIKSRKSFQMVLNNIKNKSGKDEQNSAN